MVAALKQNVLFHNFLVTLFGFFSFQKLQQRMSERGEELGWRVKIQKTNVSFDVIYFF